MLGGVCSGRESNSHQAATCEPERGAGCRDAVDWVTDISFYAAVVKDMNGLRGQVEGLQRSLYLMRSQQACGSQEQGDGSHEWEHEPEDQYSNAWESYVPIKWSCEPQGLQRGSELQSRVWAYVRKEAVGSRDRILGFSHSQVVPVFSM